MDTETAEKFFKDLEKQGAITNQNLGLISILMRIDKTLEDLVRIQEKKVKLLQLLQELERKGGDFKRCS